MLVIDQNLGESNSSQGQANVKIATMKEANSGEKSNKCNQCDYASSDPSSLRKHLKRHSGEKSNKCNHCDYTSCYASSLKTHLKIHSQSQTTNQHCSVSDSLTNQRVARDVITPIKE